MAADKSTATTYYMVQDKRGSTKPEAWREYLTTNLTPIYRKHGTYFTDEAEWLEAIIDNERRRQWESSSARPPTRTWRTTAATSP